MLGLTPFERKGYDLFNVFDDFDREFFDGRPCRMPVQMRNGFSTDIQETENGYVLESELPGFRKEDISIDVTKDYITISASDDENKDEKNEEGKFIRRERYSGSYSRSFSIAGIDADNISAEYNDGILKINMPKKSESQNTRRLEIK